MNEPKDSSRRSNRLFDQQLTGKISSKLHQPGVGRWLDYQQLGASTMLPAPLLEDPWQSVTRHVQSPAYARVVLIN